MNTKILIVIIAIVILVAGGFFVYQKISQPSYSVVLAEFTQKQQTFSPYTKYEPSFAIDKSRNKIYYVFRAMDDNDIFQIWSASSDLNGNNWQEVKQTNSSENKQRPGIIYDPKDDLIYYFYRIGNEMGASEKITRRLIMAAKSPNEEKWRNEKELIGNDGIDDTAPAVLDSSRHLIVFAYTKNNQVTTAYLDLNSGKFQETVHTNTQEMNFIPNFTYDESAGLAYIVFPRARIPRTFDSKDLWLAKVRYDGSGYSEKRLTNQAGHDNTWPFAILDLPRQKIYVTYAFFGSKPTYSAEGIPRVREEAKLGRVNLDGSGWENLGGSDFSGLKMFGIDSESGVFYGIYQEPKKDLTKDEKAIRYFAIYDPNKNKIQKQFIPSGDEHTYYDAAFRKFDNETRRLFGAQQVCRFVGERGIECQIWTYIGRVLGEGEKATLEVQTRAEMAPAQPRQLPEFKIISTQTLNDKIKINTNRKLSVPLDVKITSDNQEIKWQPSQLEFLDQDKGFQIRLPMPLAQYEVSYKICAISDPQQCKEGTVSYSGQSGSAQTSAPGVFEGQDFKITIPEGWVGTTQVQGVLLTIIRADETYPDEPNVQAINFKSYIAVASDKTNGKSVSQLAEESKNEIIKSIAGSQVVGSGDETINNMLAKFYEFDVPQQGINFKVLLAVVAKGDKVFVISFNTTAGKWPAYKDIFYQIAKSFEFKY